MNNRNQLPRNAEEQIVINRARQDGRRGTLAGAGAGGAAGYLIGGKKRRLAGAIGAIAGAVAGDQVGRGAGTAAGARDVKSARRALREMEVLHERLDCLEQRDLDRNGNDLPDAFPQPTRPMRKSVRGMRSAPGNGTSAEALFAEAREDIASRWGWGIASSLADDELDDEHAKVVHDAIQEQMAKANGPRASSNTDPEFARAFLGPNASQMSDAEVICHFESAKRKGLISLDDQDETTDFALVNRPRNDEGQFTPEDQLNSAAVQAAYSPRRRTGISASVDPDSAAEGLATATRHARKLRKAKLPRLTAGIPTLPGANFARADDGQHGHGLRDAAIAGTAVAGLTGAALLAARRLRRGRVPRLKSGTPALPPRTSPPTYDVETQVMSRRLPLLTQLAMGTPGAYPIKRRALRGKRPPTGIHPRQLGKAKPKHFGFLIHDPDLEIDPVQTRPKNAGARKIPVTKNRAQLLKWLKGMTQLSRRDFGAGGLVAGLADGLIDAATVGSATAPKKKKQLLVDQYGNVISPTFLPTPDTTSQSSFASAVERLTELGYGDVIARGAAKYLPEAAVIGSADLVAEQANAAIEARKKRRARLQLRGGIEATSPAGPQTMSEILGVVTEFDYGNERVARAERRGETIGAAGVGGVAGAVGGLRYESGSRVSPRDLKPGDRIHKRFGPGQIFAHEGVVGEDGRVTHRTRGSAAYRSVKPSSFTKTGKGPIYREKPSANDLPRGEVAKNASRANGTRAGRYGAASNNCQTAVDRLASRRTPISKQVRRAIGGAAIGAAAAGGVARIIQGKKERNGN